MKDGMRNGRFGMTKVITAAAVTSLAAYFAFRVYFYFGVLAYGVADSLISLSLLAAEGHSILHALGFILDVARVRAKKRRARTVKLSDGELPAVAIFVPVRNEPAELVERALCSISQLDYPRTRVCLLDGSTHRADVARNRALTRKFGAVHCVPRKSAASKAAIINRCLRKTREKYIAVFDVDHNPLPAFLRRTVAVAEADDMLAFVQTPQVYRNAVASPIAKGATLQQAIFYENICQAKSDINAMFCCGTNVLIRTQALKRARGFDESTVTEDLSVSLSLHALGYRSVYLRQPLAFGQAPESLAAYLKQQTRWATGTTEVLRKLIVLGLNRPAALSPKQWWEYLLSTTYYFVGWSFFFLALSPMLFLLFGRPAYFMRPEAYLAAFLPYFFMTTLVLYQAMKRRHHSAGSILTALSMIAISFPALIWGTVRGLIGRKNKFIVTPKGRAEQMSFWQLWPWHVMLALDAAAIVNALRQLPDMGYAVAVNLAWCLLYAWLLSHVYRSNTQTPVTRATTH